MELEDDEVLLCGKCDALFQGVIAYLDIDIEGECLDGVYCPSCVTQGSNPR